MVPEDESPSWRGKPGSKCRHVDQSRKWTPYTHPSASVRQREGAGSRVRLSDLEIHSSKAIPLKLPSTAPQLEPGVQILGSGVGRHFSFQPLQEYFNAVRGTAFSSDQSTLRDIVLVTHVPSSLKQ